ncbi:MAG: polynucleotide adenylyltransferase PcnB [Treponema sp.]
MLVRYKQNGVGKQIKKALVYTKAEHTIDSKKVDTEALRIVCNLQHAGYEAYIVGGAVRDLLIGKTPKDFDIVTAAEPTRIRKIFKNSRIIGKRFRLVHVFFGEKIYEVSTFRSITQGTTGNVFGTIEEDVLRRDFTFNALYYDPIRGIVIDYVGGIRDIKKKRLRAIIGLSSIFIEDPVRMLRAIKYATITHAAIPFLLRCRIHYDASLLEYVSASRLTEEINKILMSGFAHDTFALLIHYNLFLYLQPSAFAFLEDYPSFYASYFQSMRELDMLMATGSIQRQGDALVYLIRDFLHLITDWKGQPRAVYKRVYNDCRHFVLPMNPQRIELEYAVKYCLRQGGLDMRLLRPNKVKEGASISYSLQKTAQQGSGRSFKRKRNHSSSSVLSKLDT